MSQVLNTGEPIEAGQLAALEEQITQRNTPAELLALANEIDELGRRVALSISQYGPRAEIVTPLHPVLLRVPAVYTKTLLRASEKFDDVGSPLRATLVLLEAMRKAFDANMVPAVAEGLIFILEAAEQPGAAARVRELVTEPVDPSEGRRERRTRFLAALDSLREVIDLSTLEDEPSTD